MRFLPPASFHLIFETLCLLQMQFAFCLYHVWCYCVLKSTDRCFKFVLHSFPIEKHNWIWTGKILVILAFGEKLTIKAWLPAGKNGLGFANEQCATTTSLDQHLNRRAKWNNVLPCYQSKSERKLIKSDSSIVFFCIGELFNSFKTSRTRLIKDITRGNA